MTPELLIKLFSTFTVTLAIGFCFEWLIVQAGGEVSDFTAWIVAIVQCIGLIGMIFTGVWWIWI